MPGVWTGTEMVLLAGASSGGNAESDGAAYNPATDIWRVTKPGFGHPGFVPVWTGSLIIEFAKGGNVWYDPAKDEWSTGSMTFGENPLLRWSASVDGFAGRSARQQPDDQRRGDLYAAGLTTLTSRAGRSANCPRLRDR